MDAGGNMCSVKPGIRPDLSVKKESSTAEEIHGPNAVGPGIKDGYMRQI